MPPRIPPTASIAIPRPSPRTHCKSCLRRAASSKPPGLQSLSRRKFFAWLEGPGENYREPKANTTNYLTKYSTDGKAIKPPRAVRARVKRLTGSDESTGEVPERTADEEALDKAAAEDNEYEQKRQASGKEHAAYAWGLTVCPFPLNPHFVSESILSEALRLELWKRVMVEKKSVRQVSVELGVEMRRVGAVVRLVEVEKRMRSKGEELALPYAAAIHSMVPVTNYTPGAPIKHHESINDIPHHKLTEPQVFYPTSESRAFNRVDAGRVFSAAPRLPDDQDIGQGGKPAQEPWQDTRTELVGKQDTEMPILKAADSRIPHPHMIAFEKDKLDPELRNESDTRAQRYYDRLQDDQERRARAKAAKAAAEEAKKTRVDTGRWQFIVTEVEASKQGTQANGRGTKSPGYRYGVPAQDRKRGQVKIPTRVHV